MNIDQMTIEELKQLKEIVDCIINYSFGSIIKNNFIKNFYKYSIADEDKNHTLYGSFKLFGAKSFRLTSSDPNLLNMPSTGTIYAKAIKQCLIAKLDHILYIVDLAALEDRVIANLSGDKNKCSIFLDELDGHCLNSYYYFKDEIEALLLQEKDEDFSDYIKRYYKETETNKELKAIRQKSKPVTFATSYGAFPEKIANTAKIPLKIAKELFNNYHEKLYPDITKMREEYVLPTAKANGRIHLGLGCYLNSYNPDKEIRTLFNACSQFWSIITLLTINKFNHYIRKENLTNDIKVISSIYDSIYIHTKDDIELIHWINRTIIPILTKDFLKDQIVHNEAQGEIGYNWYDTIKVNNNSSIEEIESIRGKLNAL